MGFKHFFLFQMSFVIHSHQWRGDILLLKLTHVYIPNFFIYASASQVRDYDGICVLFHSSIWTRNNFICRNDECKIKSQPVYLIALLLLFLPQLLIIFTCGFTSLIPVYLLLVCARGESELCLSGLSGLMLGLSRGSVNECWVIDRNCIRVCVLKMAV